MGGSVSDVTRRRQGREMLNVDLPSEIDAAFRWVAMRASLMFRSVFARGTATRQCPYAITFDQKAKHFDQKAITFDQKAIRFDQKAITVDQKAITVDQKAITVNQKAGTAEAGNRP